MFLPSVAISPVFWGNRGDQQMRPCDDASLLVDGATPTAIRDFRGCKSHVEVASICSTRSIRDLEPCFN